MIGVNIHEVSQKTGLTKKAIKYYEMEGLIKPVKNRENNYREYSEKELLLLNVIGAMRAIDIPIKEMKSIITEEKNLNEVLARAVAVIEENLARLEKSKLIIGGLLLKGIDDYIILQEEIKKLQEALELSHEEQKEYVANTLTRIFPGPFGRIMVLAYAPFFNFAIQTKEQKEVWLKFVEYLDGLNEPSRNHPFLQLIQPDLEEAIRPFMLNMDEEVKKLLSGDEQARVEWKKHARQFVDQLQEDESFREEVEKNMADSKDLFRTIGDSDDTFNQYLAALNEDYRKYLLIWEQIKAEFEAESGYCFDNYLL